MSNSWQASTARHHFTDVVDAAVGGEPQFIKRRDGREVVVVSREYFAQTQATLASYLLTAGTVQDDEGVFDRILQEIHDEDEALLLQRQAGAAG